MFSGYRIVLGVVVDRRSVFRNSVSSRSGGDGDEVVCLGTGALGGSALVYLIVIVLTRVAQITNASPEWGEARALSKGVTDWDP